MCICTGMKCIKVLVGNSKRCWPVIDRLSVWMNKDNRAATVCEWGLGSIVHMSVLHMDAWYGDRMWKWEAARLAHSSILKVQQPWWEGHRAHHYDDWRLCLAWGPCVSEDKPSQRQHHKLNQEKVASCFTSIVVPVVIGNRLGVNKYLQVILRIGVLFFSRS